jgi:hypothetical protein
MEFEAFWIPSDLSNADALDIGEAGHAVGWDVRHGTP